MTSHKEILDVWTEEVLSQTRKYHSCVYFPDLNPSPELSYIIGLRYGDLGVSYGIADLGVEHRRVAEEFARCAEVVMKRKYEVKQRKGTTKRMFRVQVCSVVLADFLRLPLDTHKKWIEPDYPAEFCRGFYDSEGSPSTQPQIQASNTDKERLDYISDLLWTYFNIIAHVTTPPSSIKRVGKISGYIRGKPVIPRKIKHIISTSHLNSIEIFCKEIGFSEPTKKEKLKEGLKKRGRLLYGD